MLKPYRHRSNQLNLFATPRPAAVTPAHLPLSDLLPLLQTLLEGVVVAARQTDGGGASGRNERAP